MSTIFWGNLFLFLRLLAPVHSAKVCFYPNATLISLIGNHALLSSNPQTAGVVRSYSVADVTLSLSSVGAILVTQNINGSATQLWSSGHNRNCNPECRLQSQGDGNIVAYDAQGGYWSSGTCYVSQGPACSGTPQQIIFTAYWPYFLTPDVTCNVTWQISGAAQRQGPVVSTYSSPFSSTTPKPLNTFFNSFAMNTHISQGQNYKDVINSVKFLGASTIRDSPVPEVIPVGLAGIKLNLGVGVAANISVLRDALAAVQSVHTQSNNSVVSIEGANEINNWPFIYNGVDYKKSCAGYAQYQKDLYSLVKGNSVFKASGVAVYDLTAGNQGMDCAALGMLKLDGMADYANIHAYTYQYPIVTAGGDTYSGGMDHDFTGWNTSTPRVITEMGSHTWINSDGSGVDEITQSKLVVSALINGIADGYSKVFIYQLIDQVWAGYNGSESHFGLFDQYNMPKPAAKVLNQTSRLLQDIDVNSGATLKSLAFNLIGTNANVRTLLFQSQSRSSNASAYWLAIWQNLPVWNPDKNTPFTNPILPVIFNLGNVSASISVYNPYSVVGLPAAGSPLLVKSVTGTKIGIDLSDYLQLVQISISSGASIPPETTNETPGTAITNEAFYGAHLSGLAVVFCRSIAFLFL